MTIRRQLRGAGQARRPELGLPLKVLLITSRPRDAGAGSPLSCATPSAEILEKLKEAIEA